MLSRILIRTVCDFAQSKCSMRCWIEMCGGLTWSCCSCNPRGKEGKEKEKKCINK